MRDYENGLFSQVADRLRDESIIYSNILSEDFVSLQYYLTRNLYYAVVIDDYPFEISDKSSLLEALYYQVRLITVYDLNWDAIQEGLGDLRDNFLEFEGICLLFRNGKQLVDAIPNEFSTLQRIIHEINEENQSRKIKIILNGVVNR